MGAAGEEALRATLLSLGPPAQTSSTFAADERPRRAVLAVVVGCWALFVALGVGLVSSNDGSHVALARALATRGSVELGPDVGLTLMVDRARRDGRDYSDRPPGTALAAVLAVALGAALDPALARRSRSSRELVVVPGGWPYLGTYAVRSPDGPPLYERQGTALLARIQAATVAALGLWLLVGLARLRGLSGSGSLMAILGLGLASLWGPYGTALFSHDTAGVSLLAMVLCLQRAQHDDRAALSVLAGTCGAFAVATDYALVLAVVPMALVLTERSRLWLVLAGAAPVALVVAAYHQIAFGSPFAIGYDHHQNFAFARSRMDTFDGNPLRGLWILWGAGEGAGLLVMAPVMLVGALGFMRSWPRLALALAPWLVTLCFHHTPWGGAGIDHRYLVPVMPLFALGLGRVWDGLAERRAARGAVVLLAIASGLLTWSHFLQWTRG